MAKIIAIKVELSGITGIITDSKSLKAAIKQTNEELSKTRFGSESYKKLNSQLAVLKNTQQNVTQATKNAGREHVIAADKGRKSYRAMNAELVNARRRFKELSDIERRSPAGKTLVKNIRVLDKELKKLDKTIGNSQREVGNYFGAFKKAAGAAFFIGGITGAVQSLTRFIGDSIQVTADFERQISILGAVSGATSKELETLEADAKELGATTQFTASQVAQLQVEYAKLGFTPSEILDATASSLDTASVSQAELAQVAKVTGATIRAFGLDASEAGRVSDVMSVSFANSALDINKFETAMATVAPVAANAGVSLEQTTELMGLLADRGVDASTIGSGLRNVFLDLSKHGLTFNQAMEKINSATDANAAAMDLFGKRGATVGAILAKTTSEVTPLGDALADATGKAKEMASALTDDLQGDLDAAKSAAEGFQIAFGQGFEGAIRGVTQFIAKGIRVLTKGMNFVFEAFKPVTDIIGELISELGFAGQASSVFENIINVLRGTILVVANVIRVLVNGVVQFIKIAKTIAQATGLDKFFNKLVKDVQNFQKALSLLPAVLNGVIRAVGVIQQRFSDFFRGGIIDLQIFSAKAKGIFSQAARDQVQELQKQRAAIKGVGQTVGEAFRQGFDEARGIEQFTIEVPEEAGEEAGKNLGVSLVDAFEEEISGGDGLAAASVAALSKVVTELKKEIKEAAPEDAATLIEKLVGAEVDLAAAQAAIDKIKALASGKGRRTTALAPIQSISSGPISVSDQGARDAASRRIEAQAEADTLIALQTIDNEKELQARLAEIKRDATISNLQLQLTAEGLSNQAKLDLEVELQEQRNETAAAAAKERQEIETQAINAIQSVLSIISQVSRSRTDAEIAQIEDKYDREIEAAEGNEARISELEAEKAEKTAALQEEQFEREKRLSTIQAIIAGAVAIVQAFAQLGPIAGAIAALAIAATTIAQVATIQNQQFTAAQGALIDTDGGVVHMGGFAQGRSHKQGGIKFGNMEIQGGEFVDRDEFGNTAIINKKNSGTFAGTLKRMAGKRFPGKSAMLSGINSYNGNGIPFSRMGADLVPSPRALASFGSTGTTIGLDSALIAGAVESGAASGVYSGMAAKANAEAKQKYRSERLQRRLGEI